jgi:hypothetical protein
MSAQSSSQPYFDAATGQYLNAGAQAQPYMDMAGRGIGSAQAAGAGLAGASLSSLAAANQSASPLQSDAARNISQGLAAAQPFNSAAGSLFAQGLGAAQPLNQAANQNITAAQAGAQPYQGLATNLGLAGSRAVDPSQISAANINQFMSPYLSTVLGSTQALLSQQNEQEQSGQLGNAIRSGAFGGDRAGIAAASLKQQQQLANSKIYSDILNQGYGQALGAAQQQQGLGLSAEQANRAAQASAAGQLAAIGQQGFGQGITTAQQQAALGQQQYGQSLGTGQAVQGLGNQVYGQNTGTGQAQAGLGNQLFSQGAQTAQQQAALSQQMFGQGLGAAQAYQGLGGQLYTQGAQTGQNLQGLGQAQFGNSLSAGQSLANLGQQNFGVQSQTGLNLANLGSQLFSQGSQTGQNLASVGNQLFNQGSQTGQNLINAGGQLFSQGSQTGLNLANLGQQNFGVQSQTGQSLQGLGQAQFGNAITTGQNAAQLGQQVYGTGAATSQALAGLGAGAQAAGLQGAQAQLAAGQTQQQTQQAGLTALYNQFLQQQSYPFQIAQFLANIAEGTGALSGSTTTSTQPGGFFSDEKLKEGVKQIGETYDGLKIVKYRYKDDPTWRVGFLAQDVEKKHPDAVGESQGFKTVDYGKASEAAAKRGHFASGGPAFADGGLAGFDPELMQQMLENAHGMYGPYMAAGGGGPYGGGLARVPAANLPVGQLKLPGEAPKVKSPMEHAKEFADMGISLDKDVDEAKKGIGWVSKKFGHDEMKDLYAGGGRVGLAAGGLPYENQVGPMGLDIPTEKPDLDSLPKPGVPPRQQSGLGKAKDAAETALDVAKIAAMFAGMKRGGAAERKGYALGGEPEDEDALLQAAAADDALAGGAGEDQVRHGPFYSSPRPTVTSNEPARPFGTMQTDSRGDHYWNPWGPKKAPEIDVVEGLKRRAADFLHTPELIGKTLAHQVDQRVNPERAPSAPVAVVHKPTPRPIQRGLAAAAQPPPGAPPAPSGLMPASAPMDAETIPALTRPDANVPDLDSASLPQVSPPSRASQAADWLKTGPIGNYFSGLKHGDAPSWVSLLSALGAAGTAPTVHPGVALAAGLSAGARGYMGAKAQQTDIAKTKAEIALTGAQTKETSAQAGYVHVSSLKGLKDMLGINGYVPVPDPKGKWEIEGVRYGAVPATSALVKAEGEAPPAEFKPVYLGEHGQGAADHAFDRFAGATQEAVKTSNENMDTVYREADDAVAHVLPLNRYAASLAGNPNGLLTGGALHDLRVEAANRWNTLMAAVGVKQAQISGLDDAQMATKMTIGTAAMNEAGYGQRSALAFKAFLAGVPSQGMQRGAALNLVSDLQADNLRAIDQGSYFKEFADSLASKYGEPAARNFLATDALNAFNTDYTPDKYEVERNKYAALLASPVFAKVNQVMQSGSEEQRIKAAKQIDELAGQAGFHRWLTGKRLY